MKCPNCGTALTFDPGEPGDSYGPPIPAGWGCDNCGYDPDDAPDVPVPHCWADELSQYEVGSAEWTVMMLKGNATCLLPAGHGGPHEFIPDSEITVEFGWEEVEVDNAP